MHIYLITRKKKSEIFSIIISEAGNKHKKLLWNHADFLLLLRHRQPEFLFLKNIKFIPEKDIKESFDSF